MITTLYDIIADTDSISLSKPIELGTQRVNLIAWNCYKNNLEAYGNHRM